MSPQIIGVLINLILTINISYFIIHLFGNEAFIVHKWPFYKKWILKVGLSLTAAGCLYNALTLEIESWSNIITYAGFALIFSIATYAHRKIFRQPIRNEINSRSK